MSKDLTGHDLFWLARRAYNAFQPLVERARATVEGRDSINFYVELRDFHQNSSDVAVRVFHYGPNEFLTHADVETAEEIDALAAKFEAKVIEHEIDKMNRDIVAGLITTGVVL